MAGGIERDLGQGCSHFNAVSSAAGALIEREDGLVDVQLVPSHTGSSA